MPWRGPEQRGDFPSLGYAIADWIEDHCVIPDGDHQGEPFVLTDEQMRFVVFHYRLELKATVVAGKPSAPFVFRRSQLRRPQKWGKGPLGAAIICAEAEGPALFDGWDADGEPVGRPWPTPHVQVTAVSEDQTDNVWRALKPMIELGPLADVIPDTGETRINLRSGGLIEPVTASAVSRLGQRITFALQDQTESWLKENGGHKLADNQRRNLGGTGGRSIETPNAWDPNEKSVAQRTFQAKRRDVYLDSGPGAKGDFSKKGERTRILRAEYGDSAAAPADARWRPWVDLDRIEAECAELIAVGEVAQAERWYGNRLVAGSDVAFNIDRWHELAKPKLFAGRHRREPAAAGFDGSRFHDATGLIVTHLETGHQMVAGVWQWTDALGIPPESWEVPVREVEGALEEIFDVWDLHWLYADPHWWDADVDRWIGKWGAEKVVPFYTHRPGRMAPAVRAYANAQALGEVSHDEHPQFAEHIANARKRLTNIRDDQGKRLWVITKENDDSPLKIDLAMAGCISWEARNDAIAAGALQKKRRRGGSV